MRRGVKRLAECLEHSSCSQIVSKEEEEEGGGDQVDMREEC